LVDLLAAVKLRQKMRTADMKMENKYLNLIILNKIVLTCQKIKKLYILLQKENYKLNLLMVIVGYSFPYFLPSNRRNGNKLL